MAKDITIPKEAQITVYVNGDIALDPKKSQMANAASDPTSSSTATSPAAQTNAGPAISSVDVKSTPDGADVTVDDKFMGNTPSTLKLAAADHKIKAEKAGFKT